MQSSRKVNGLFEKIKTDISLSPAELNILKEHVKIFSKKIEKPLKKINSKISIFLGGSLAKGTVIRKKERYDVDLFIIFPEEFKVNYQNRTNLFRLLFSAGWPWTKNIREAEWAKYC